MEFVSVRNCRALLYHVAQQQRFYLLPTAVGIGAGIYAWKQSRDVKAIRCASLPWVPTKRNPAVLEILLVRHGESENNVSMEKIYEEHRRLGSDFETTHLAFLEVKKDDPSLSAQGIEQAEAFAATYASDLQQRGCVVYSSPSLRTLQTAKPLAALLNSRVVIAPTIFEVGGVYTFERGGKRGTGKCLSAQEILSMFPGYDVSALPKTGQWYTGKWETDAEARTRFVGVAQWLRSDELRKEINGSIMVVVCHGHMIDMLLKELSGTPDNAKSDVPFANNHADRPYFMAAGNTATVRLTIKANGNVVVHSFGDMSHLRVHAASGVQSGFVGG